ncbi:MAG: (2Fe-2S)-binding protein, partial [Anaerolineales bacterium]|nr:(2Fe-2S)-binding protein [Anaerolineales bacterium]
CECELVTRAMIENAVKANPTLTIDDLRRDVRLGKGPCQGGFCTYRATGILHELRQSGFWQDNIRDDAIDKASWNVAYLQSPGHQSGHNGHGEVEKDEVETATSTSLSAGVSAFSPNLLLRDFLQERWKGVSPILWGRQLKQERLDELIYLSLMNVEHLPDEQLTSPLTDFYHYDVTPRESDSEEVSNG